MTKIGIAYGFYRGNWIGHSTNHLFELLKKEFGDRSVAVQKIGVLDTEVRITNNKLDILDVATGESLKDLAGIYFANWRKQPEFSLALGELMVRQGKPILSQEVLQVMPMSKLGEMVLMSDQGIPLPDSIFMRSKHWLKRLKRGGELPFKPPFIAKVIDGSMGTYNFLVKNKAQLKTILQEDLKRIFVMQNFIPNDSDYRVIIIGGQPKLVMKRTRANDSTHVNNTSQGAKGELVDPESMPEGFTELALKAARAVRRPSFAGVDIIQDSQTGKFYVLEVNKTPQMETGTNTAQKVEALVSYFVSNFKEGS